ncbi:DUF4383 domain-containing protein [Lentzea flaviverrucosa]|uniref:DUF4383 domain-containing protein n=1 Tax=Lentzea flaviverrucosa TaxID=200379 RepID=A0A1H9XY44_9PSEU|nr:DUF4383 domain-containing protein [Lentzea flaviverrucosa]RDI16576.1 uncharacterized protein DUF4383 [Lentzea flaviverrucosa]SES51006.1 protein of unknown function [Lentzea flaviverrucosa]
MNRLRWPQKLAIGTGALLVLWGVAGFFVTGFSSFAGEADTWVLGLRVNPLQNVIHLVFGAALLSAVPRLKALSGTGLLLAVLFLVMFGLGLARYDGEVVNFLNVNPGSNALHLFAGFASLAAAQGAAWCRQCDRAAAVKPA